MTPSVALPASAFAAENSKILSELVPARDVAVC
jgi:hypothetical protein